MLLQFDVETRALRDLLAQKNHSTKLMLILFKLPNWGI